VYNKFNNTIIADSLDEIPASELIEGIQIITFDSDRDYYSELPVDATRTMIFTRRLFGKCLAFQGVINTPCHDWTEGDNGDVRILGATYNQKNFGQMLVEFEGELIEVMYDEDNNRPELYNYKPNDEDDNNPQEQMLQAVHNLIFNIYENKNVIYNQIKADNQKSYHFLSIPFDMDNAIVFIYEHTLDIDKKVWRTQKHSWIISKEYVGVELWDMQEIFYKFSQTSVGNNPDFKYFDEEEEFVANYDMGHFLHEENNSEEDFARIRKVFEVIRPNIEIERLFQPYYVNNKMNFKAYISSYKDFRTGFYFNYNGEYITERQAKTIDTDIVEEIRVAKVMYSFFEMNQNGVNPKTGEYCKNGQLALTNDVDIMYRDADAILVKAKSEWQPTVYIKIKGHFMRADDTNYPSDREKIQAMYDRKAVMERLMKAKR
jgi:hypothetical protein